MLQRYIARRYKFCLQRYQQIVLWLQNDNASIPN